MKRTLPVLGSAWLMLLACTTDQIPQPVTEPGLSDDYSNHPRQASYQAALQTFNQKWNCPGTIMLLKRASESVWAGAVGKANLEYQTDLRLSDQFRTGSITKTFVATVVMKLREQGKLQLDDKLAMLLPEVTGKIPNAETITLRHMLSHTSGIFDPTNDDRQYQLDLLNNPAHRTAMSTDEVLAEYVYGRPLDFQPGDRYGYSNTNYWLIGKLIEKQTGQSLQQVLEQFIFKPLGLTNTYIDRRDDRNVVRGYNDFYANGKLMDVTTFDRADSDGQANGGLISTAGDLFAFSNALFSGKLISLTSVKEMMTVPPVRQGTTEYGLGLDSYQSPIGTAWGHNGTLLGVDANWFYFPDKQSIYIIFANNGGGADKSFVHDLLSRE
ncbi:serine hydrolase domain-containing protein [Spirosoma endbachense]|uniref:Serine hydrolase n=1 Tax=Spirosoma endbachense TaxID=2666025 RepID=A0A6P1VPZ8_9BACT|nr:serine hydrolase domain-containing protein [Spirosoma endbachense]QHV93679.1 serine hydrolase [Spirosoma endbachense]